MIIRGQNMIIRGQNRNRLTAERFTHSNQTFIQIKIAIDPAVPFRLCCVARNANFTTTPVHRPEIINIIVYMSYNG